MLMRRAATALPLRNVAHQARNYTEVSSHHKTYPVCYPMYFACLTIHFSMWLCLFRMGSVYSSRNAYKKDTLKSWYRKLGTGYAWGDEVPAKVTTFYKNLPTGTA